MLLKRLLSFFATDTAAAEADTNFVRLNDLAPLGESLPGSAVICREPVLNRQERVAGQHFFLPRHRQSPLRDKRERIRRAHDEALLHNLAGVGLEAMLGEHLAFLDLSPAALTSVEALRLPPDNLVLVVDIPAGLPPPTPDLLPCLERLAARGYLLGWQAANALPPALAPALLAQVRYLVVDLPNLDPEALQSLPQRFWSATTQPLQLVARQTRSYEEFRACFALGFDYFQGSFVSQRQDWRQPGQSLNRLQVVMLLNLIRRGSEAKELALALRQDPVLTFKLLRYINSPAVGLQRPLESVDQALLLLGREQLYRWLSLLLLHVDNPGGREWILMERALVRAAVMERLLPALADEAFLTGLLSILDELLGLPLEILLADLTLAPPVAAALLHGEGPLAALLALACSCDSGRELDIDSAAAHGGFAPAAINGALAPALAWAQKVLASADGERQPAAALSA